MTSRRLLGAVAASVLLFAAVAVAGRSVESDTSRLVFVAPTVEQPQPEWVEGQPVWVTRRGSQVIVLDAINPHRWMGMRELVGWCKSAGSFGAYWDGSRFDPQGRWQFGPAPTSLGVYGVTPMAGNMMAVAPQPVVRERGGGGMPTTQPCRSDGDPADRRPAVFHEPRNSGLATFDGHVVVTPEGAAVFCAELSDTTPPTCAPPVLRIPGVQHAPAGSLLRGRLLGRRHDGELRDPILMPGGTLVWGAH